LEEAVKKFVDEFLRRYENKKNIVQFILKAVNSNPELTKDKDFMKAVIVFTASVSDTELDLMAEEGVNVDEFLDIVSEFENELVGLTLDVDDIEELEKLKDSESD